MLAVKELTEKIYSMDTHSYIGRVKKISGEIIEADGPICKLNELVELVKPGNEQTPIIMELIGFDNRTMKFMSYQSTQGIQVGDLIRNLSHSLQIPVSPKLIGRVINFAGHPLDYGNSIPGTLQSVFRSPPDLLKRKLIDTKLNTGIKCIDALLTVGQGQRMGIFSGPGLGKSILMSMVAKYSQADLNVISLVGERGREVKEFIEKHLGPEGMRKTIIVASTSEEPPLSRIRNVFTANTIAEYFRDQGLHVMLIIDSITRLAQAQRELSISLKEPPISRGYPPSLFNLLPKLLERAGKGEKGSITAFYSVLVEGGDLDEPISDVMRGLLDGHITLSHRLANKGHYPAIDIGQSVSRLMVDLVDKNHLEATQKIREWLSSYYEMEDMIQVGAYVKGSNPILDTAIAKKTIIDDFLRQGITEFFPAEESLQKLYDLVL